MEKELENEIKCCYCLQQLDKPKLLSCLHTLCEECVKPLIQGNSDNLLCCVCSRITMVGMGFIAVFHYLNLIKVSDRFIELKKIS